MKRPCLRRRRIEKRSQWLRSRKRRLRSSLDRRNGRMWSQKKTKSSPLTTKRDTQSAPIICRHRIRCIRFRLYRVGWRAVIPFLCRERTNPMSPSGRWRKILSLCWADGWRRSWCSRTSRLVLPMTSSVLPRWRTIWSCVMVFRRSLDRLSMGTTATRYSLDVTSAALPVIPRMLPQKLMRRCVGSLTLPVSAPGIS